MASLGLAGRRGKVWLWPTQKARQEVTKFLFSVLACRQCCPLWSTYDRVSFKCVDLRRRARLYIQIPAAKLQNSQEGAFQWNQKHVQLLMQYPKHTDPVRPGSYSTKSPTFPRMKKKPNKVTILGASHSGRNSTQAFH